MASGKRRPTRALVPGAIAALVGVLLFASCSPAGGVSFSDRLRDIDQLLAAGPPRGKLEGAFARAYRSARDSGQWLSLAKRSPAAEAAGDLHRDSRTADAALRALRDNSTVAAAAVWLYLRDGLADKAFALFPEPLKPDLYPDLWAEARLLRLEAHPVTDPAECGRLAMATGNPSWYLDAALLSMREGKRFAAQSWLKAGISGGLRPALSILWDAGLTQEILDRGQGPLSSEDLSIAADAAWMEGDRSAALGYWRRAFASTGDQSWQTEASLAVLAEPGAPALDAARRLVADRPENPEALRYAALLLLDNGASDEAAALAPSLLRGSLFPAEALGLELQAGERNEGRFVAQAIRVAEEHPGSSGARQFALRVLFAHGRWDEYLVVYDGASPPERADPNWWFWEMTALILRGDRGAASQIAGSMGASPLASRGPEGAFAQGLMAALAGHKTEALSRFNAALALCTEGSQRAAALKEIGKIEESLGHHSRALEAWSAAHDADPDDAEAGILAAESHN